MRLKASPNDLTHKDYAVLAIIENGSDVFGAQDTRHLRGLDRRIPHIVKFFKPRNPDAAFGVRCTPKGRALLRQYEVEKLGVPERAGMPQT